MDSLRCGDSILVADSLGFELKFKNGGDKRFNHLTQKKIESSFVDSGQLADFKTIDREKIK